MLLSCDQLPVTRCDQWPSVTRCDQMLFGLHWYPQFITSVLLCCDQWPGTSCQGPGHRPHEVLSWTKTHHLAKVSGLYPQRQGRRRCPKYLSFPSLYIDISQPFNDSLNAPVGPPSFYCLPYQDTHTHTHTHTHTTWTFNSLVVTLITYYYYSIIFGL